jgi:hypothetical protein
MELKSMTSEELANGKFDLLNGQEQRKILNKVFSLLRILYKISAV